MSKPIVSTVIVSGWPVHQPIVSRTIVSRTIVSTTIVSTAIVSTAIVSSSHQMKPIHYPTTGVKPNNAEGVSSHVLQYTQASGSNANVTLDSGCPNSLRTLSM